MIDKEKLIQELEKEKEIHSSYPETFSAMVPMDGLIPIKGLLEKIRNGHYDITSKPQEKCKWEISDIDFDDDVRYETSCDQIIAIFQDYTPSDCNYKYCTFCGKEIESI